MSEPQIRSTTRTNDRKNFTEKIYDEVIDTHKRIDRVEKELDRVNIRLDRVELRMDRIENRLDEIHKEIKTAMNHGNIMTASVVGIALAVIYSVLK